MAKKMIKEHVAKKTLTEIVLVPEHEQRTESKEFRQTKKKLKEDGHYECWICGSTENLECHHMFCEWSLSKHVDYKKLKEICETFDIYGYGKEMKDIPMTSVDDIRNQMILCREHHYFQNDGSQNGIHALSFPVWISQKVCIDGKDPVPDNAEEVEIAQRLALDDKPDF